MGMDPDPDTLTRNPSKKGGLMSFFGTRQSAPSDRRHHTIREGSLARHEPRRPLKTTDLSPPDYKVESELLIDSYLEKEIKYLGVIPNVPFGLDPTKRTELLRYVDEGKRGRKLPLNTKSREYDAILSLSAKNVRLIKRDGEEVLHRIEIHNIAAVSYVRDDDQHILAFKTAIENNTDLCNLIICECENKEKADEICSLVQQTFVLVYTELTMKFFDKQINPGRPPSGRGDTSIYSGEHRRRSPTSQASTSNYGTPESQRYNGANSTDELSVTAKVLLQEYIEVLRKQLNSEELQQFAATLREYRQTGSIKEFCTRLQQLYGPNRTNLFPGMRQFVPDHDLRVFERFLREESTYGSYTTGSDITATSASDSTSSSVTLKPGDRGWGRPGFFSSSISSGSSLR